MKNEIRFCDNNFITTQNSTLTNPNSANFAVTEESLTGNRTKPTTLPTTFVFFPQASALPRRGHLLKSNLGNAEIYPAEDLPVSAIATTIATRLEADIRASFDSSAVVTYNNQTGLYRLQFSAPTTLLFSDDTDTAWDILGFTQTSDVTTQDISSDQPRFAGQQSIDFDFLTNVTPTTFAALGLAGRESPFSLDATLTVSASTSSNLDEPDYVKTFHNTREGFLGLLDIEDANGYRYFRILVSDEQNKDLIPVTVTIGGNSFSVQNNAIHYLYLGDHVPIPRGLSSGFNISFEDLSEIVSTGNGVVYSNERVKLRRFLNCAVANVQKSTVNEIQDFFLRVGQSRKFLLLFDPLQYASGSINQLSCLAAFPSLPSIEHIVKDFYNVSFEVVEVL